MKIIKINNSCILDISQVAGAFATIQNNVQYLNLIIKAQMGEPKEFKYVADNAEELCYKVYEALREFHKEC